MSTSTSQRFTMRSVPRSEISTANYNPRKISKEARLRLKHLIQTKGLVMPLVWNSRTGALVGGHQRLSIIDELEGRTDYSLDVAVVDLDARSEKELNVALNSPGAQGTFDTNKLDLVLEDLRVGGGIDAHALALDLGDLSTLRQDKKIMELGGEESSKASKKAQQLDPAVKEEMERSVVIVFQDVDSLDRFRQAVGLRDSKRYEANDFFLACGVSIPI